MAKGAEMSFDLYYLQSHAIQAFVLATVVLLLYVLARLASVGNIVALALATTPVLFLWVFVNTPVGPFILGMF